VTLHRTRAAGVVIVTLLLGVGEPEREQVAHVVVRETVDGSLAVTLPRHQAKVAQHAQLVGDRRLAHPGNLGEVAHTQRLARQRQQKAHARRVRQRTEDVGQSGGGRGPRQRADDPRDGSRVHDPRRALARRCHCFI